jgi:hypothetical protein
MHGKSLVWALAIAASISQVSCAVDQASPDYLAVRDLTPVKVLPTPRHAPVVLVADGQAKAKVYLADPQPSTSLDILVKELREAVKLASGAELPVVKDMPGEDVPTIVVGDCPASRAAGIDAAAIPIEGFVVKTAANRVFLVGSTVPLTPGSNKWEYWYNDGTAWAVADMLERFVGVRWYWPVNVGGRSVPATRALVVRPAFYSDQPVFRKREFYPNTSYDVPRDGKGPIPAPPDSAIPADVKQLDMTVLLAGLRGGNSWPYTIKVHNPQNIWRNQKLVDEHPELFMKKADGKINASMLCYGSPATLKFLLDGCEAFWDKKPAAMEPWCKHGVSWCTATCVTLSPFDEPIHCYCENCLKLYDPKAINRATGSRIMVTFLKKFAEEVRRRWPDKKVLYLPYWNYVALPEGISLPDNIEIQMCTMSFAMMRQPAWRGREEQYIRDWSRQVGGKIQTWEYPHRTIEYPGAQLQYPHLIKDYYQHNRELLTGSFLNGGSILDWSKAAPSHYCFMKILWNPDLDVDAALDVMCQRMFGKAAGTARELLARMADRWEKAPWSIEMDDMGYLEPAIYRETWPPEVVEKMMQLWQKARAELKDDPAARQRFLYVTWTMEHMPEEVQAHSAPQATTTGPK